MIRPMAARLPRGFHLVPPAEVEQDPEFDPGDTSPHRDGRQCDCPGECREWLNSKEGRAWLRSTASIHRGTPTLGGRP